LSFYLTGEYCKLQSCLTEILVSISGNILTHFPTAVVLQIEMRNRVSL